MKSTGFWAALVASTGLATGIALPLNAAPSVGTAAQDGTSLEARFDAMIDPSDQVAWLKDMASAPNHVGSQHDKANAEMELALFRKWGWDAHIETFQVLYPTPISTSVEMIAPQRVTLGGQEPAVPGDGTSSSTAAALPPYLIYQGDGDVTAPVVYVNYGMPDDYEALARRGIDVKGKIVLARYGGGWRGLKPKLAQEHGAAGCLIYSDPANDGYATGDSYPRGGARPEQGVQRGSVEDMTTYPGDPLTPGVGATQDAHRLDSRTVQGDPQDPRAPDFLWRCVEDPGGAAWPGSDRGRARRFGNDLSLGRHRYGKGASGRQVGVVAEAGL